MKITLLTAALLALLSACQSAPYHQQQASVRAGRPFNAQTHRFEDPQQPPYPTSPGDASR